HRPMRAVLNVEGVGNGRQQCAQFGGFPIALPVRGHESAGTPAVYAAPIVPESDMPALLGLRSLRQLRAPLDIANNRIHFLGPGDAAIQLPPGTRARNLEGSEFQQLAGSSGGGSWAILMLFVNEHYWSMAEGVTEIRAQPMRWCRLGVKIGQNQLPAGQVTKIMSPIRRSMLQELTAQLWRQQRCSSENDSGHEEMIQESQRGGRDTLDTPNDTGAGRTKMVRFEDTDGHCPTEARLRQKRKEKEAKDRAAADGTNEKSINNIKNMSDYGKVWTDCGDDMSSVDLGVSELWMAHVTADLQQYS
ncbi:unnamed protein product, partial [Prorocentrum cordatum]